MKRMIKKAKKGFTLVELVVVIAIIAILSGVSVGVYVGITEHAKKTAADSEATTIANVVRAAVLMDADGYEFKYNDNNESVVPYSTSYASGLKDCRATWNAEKGIAFEIKNGETWEDVNSTPVSASDATKKYVNFNENTAIKSIYLQTEKLDGKNVGTITVADGTENGYADKFTYTTTSNYTSGTVSILAGGTK